MYSEIKVLSKHQSISRRLNNYCLSGPHKVAIFIEHVSQSTTETPTINAGLSNLHYSKLGSAANYTILGSTAEYTTR